MFRQAKSALFWYYLYKFRKRVIVIFLLLIIAIFANAIYSDVIEYLKLKNKLEFLELALFSKWTIIIFNLTFSIYLILTTFKKDDVTDKKKEKNSIKTKEKKVENTQTKVNKEEKFSDREKQFLYKKKLRTKADLLVDK